MIRRIAIVTNRLPHHKYFCVEMARHHDVRLILHPTVHNKAKSQKVFSRGLFWAGLKACSKLYNRLFSDSLMRDFDYQEKRFFSEAAEHYRALDSDIIKEVDSVNSEEAIAFLKEKEVDIVLFLGGDLAQKEFIESVPQACYNVHSGLSPLYNGNSSFAWAVADSRPNFAGVTLMRMNERIDGGDILAHHLQEINSTDTASSLFMKGIKGAVEMYHDLLFQAYSGKIPEGVPQQRSVRYTSSMDWTIQQDLLLRRFMKRDRMKLYQRNKKTIFYNQEKKTKSDPFAGVLSHILQKPTKHVKIFAEPSRQSMAHTQ